MTDCNHKWKYHQVVGSSWVECKKCGMRNPVGVYIAQLKAENKHLKRMLRKYQDCEK